MTIIEIVNPKAPKTGGVKVDNDTPLDVRKPLPSWNFASLVAGVPGSGKTSLIINLVKKYYKKKFNTIHELLDDILASGMDPNYWVYKDGKSIGTKAIDLIQF